MVLLIVITERAIIVYNAVNKGLVFLFAPLF